MSDKTPEQVEAEAHEVARIGELLVAEFPDNDIGGGVYQPSVRDRLAAEPVKLDDGWHPDLVTGWNFEVTAGRLVRAVHADHAAAETALPDLGIDVGD